MTDWTLRRHPSFGGVKGPVVVVVMDGVGIGAHDEGDAVWLARTPTLDRLAETALTTRLRAHGKAVGLPSDDDMGNSEVGHNALGAGRVYDQGAKRVNAAIASGEIFRGEEWKRLVAKVRESGEPMHFIGLLSDGNVHSHIEHLFALVHRCHEEEIPRVRIHVLLDGRDVPETSALEYVARIEAFLDGLRAAGRDYRVASGGGRMKVTMDRYGADWAMVKRGWETHVRGEGRGFRSVKEAVETIRSEQPGIIDQNLPAFVIVDGGGAPVGPIRDGAAVVFFNFRGDRAIEISRAFEDESFEPFDRGPRPDVAYAGMMQYDGDLLIPKHYLVTPPEIERTVGEYMVRNGVSIYASAETQKYGHVTYFWNGNRGGMIDERMERYLEVPSDPLPFEERPWMKAAEVTDRLIEALQSGKVRHARVNYANGDMVGHTGVLEASVVAVEAVDLSIARLIPVIDRLEGALIVTADHGNADEMIERDRKSGALLRDARGRPRPKTSHTLNPVVLHVRAPSVQDALRLAPVESPGLAGVAATLLLLLGFERPDDYAPALISIG